MLVANRNGEQRVIFVEAKRTSDGPYISDSIYKVFGYACRRWRDRPVCADSDYPKGSAVAVCIMTWKITGPRNPKRSRTHARFVRKIQTAHETLTNS
jgi:hypothetical protein